MTFEIDDMNPQIYGVLIDMLLAAGAHDVYYTPVQMKKNRPGTLVTVMAPPERRPALSAIVFRETTTLGVRYHDEERDVLDREIVTVTTAWGPVPIKVARLGGVVTNAAPEFEACAGPGPQQRRPGQGHPGGGDEGLARSRPDSIHPLQSPVRFPVSSPPFFLTTAIDYANGKPHLGTAYEKITADVIARYKRLCGIETHFLMGLDEHSLNVYRKAREQGLDPLVYCDQMAAVFRDVWARLDISFDDFIRTTEPRHKVAVQAMTEKIRANGDLYEGVYEGWYCESCEAFKPEKDLVDGLCPIHRTKPVVDPRDQPLLPPVGVSRSSAGALRCASGVPAAGRAAQRDPAPARSRARGHLDQPRRAAVGHPGAVRSRRASSTSGSTR